jgi:hypothetical protein
MALPQPLNFLDQQRKAASSRSFRSKLASSNGITFNCADEIVFDLGGNVSNSYYDMNTMYVEFLVTNNDGANVKFDGGAGAYSLIERAQMTSAGSTLSNVSAYNNLVNCLFDSTVSSNYNRNVAHAMFGTSLEGKSYEGATIATTASRKVCLPLILLAPCNTTPNRFFPAFSKDRLQIRLTLAEATTAFFHTVAGLANSDISITGVSLNFYTVELAREVQAQIDQMTGGRYDMMCNDYIHASSSVVAGTTAHTATLGFTSGSLERVTVCHRTSGNIGDVTKHSFTRSSSNLSQWQLAVNNSLYPSRPLLVDGVSNAEVMSELLIADHALHNFGVTSNFNSNGATQSSYFNVSDASGVVVGSFLTAVELESFAGSEKVYAGINTVSATTQLQLEYNNTSANGDDVSTTAVPNNTTIDIYGLRTVKISLDMRNLGTYEIFV